MLDICESSFGRHNNMVNGDINKNDGKCNNAPSLEENSGSIIGSKAPCNQYGEDEDEDANLEGKIENKARHGFRRVSNRKNDVLSDKYFYRFHVMGINTTRILLIRIIVYGRSSKYRFLEKSNSIRSLVYFR